MKKEIRLFLIYSLKRIMPILVPILVIVANFFYCKPILASDLEKIIYKLKNNKELQVFEVAKEETEKWLKKLNNLDSVEYAEANSFYQTALIPSDLLYNEQWYLQKIKANEAWDIVRESPEIVIAIIDSGVQINHPDLRNNIWRNIMEAPNGIDDDKNGYVDDINGWDFVEDSADPSPKFREGFTENGIMHGTVVAGAVAASGNNATGISGVSWRTQIMPLKVLSDSGMGEVRDVVRAIDYAIENGADIINLSFVGFNYSRSLENAIRKAYEAGIIIVAAAGNEQGEGYGYSLDVTSIYPACYDGESGENMVIGVAATDSLDQKAPFSSYGFRCVDISAPGVSIFSTATYSPYEKIDNNFLNKHYDGYWSGTSMATPLVSGAVALIQAANPLLDRNEVIDALINSTDNINRLNPGYLGQLGSGRLNLEKAVINAQARLSTINKKLILSPYSSKESEVVITSQNGKKENNFLAYANNFKGGVRTASGDVDGDGIDEIVTAAGYTGGPHIRIFSKSGELISQFFAFDENFRGGLSLAVADLNKDGIAEIITGMESEGSPMVRIFDYQGKKRRQFFAYNKDFNKGIKIAVGDINGDSYNEIVTGTSYGGGPQIRIFNRFGILEGQFFAFDKNLRTGVNVAILNSQNSSRITKARIITSPAKGFEPIVRIYDNHAQLENQFNAYQKDFIGGVNVAAADFDQDGTDEVITGAAGEGAPHVRIFQKKGKLINSFYAFEKDFLGGVYVSAIDINN